MAEIFIDVTPDDWKYTDDEDTIRRERSVWRQFWHQVARLIAWMA